MTSKKVLRIGTRDSKLALWQANLVKQLLEDKGVACTLVPIKSEGDLNLVTPLYAMGVQGVFTRTLDAYLLSRKIDIAVHSMKDVPTQLAQGICQVAVLARADYRDLLVYKTERTLEAFTTEDRAAQQVLRATVATGSVRRKAQLLHRFPLLSIENLRGNVQTRMQKLENSHWDAALFAAAGLERINERPAKAIPFDWMLPAPAQGAIMVVCRAEDELSKEATVTMNDAPTAMCVKVERDFLNALMGGCSAPISALAQIHREQLQFTGNVLSLDGKEKLEVSVAAPVSDAAGIGIQAAQQLLQQGAGKLVEATRNFGQ